MQFYLIYFFPILFIGMWLLVSFVISKMGWTDLVAKYHYPGIFVGQRIGLISASINNANYGNALILKYNKEGIYLKTVFLFSLFHKPIFIPWAEIKEARDKKLLFFNFKELIIGDPFIAIMRIKKATFSKMEYDFAAAKN